MTTFKRNIRNVIDAGYDLYGAQSANSSNNVGWTPMVVIYWGNGHQSAMSDYNTIALDSNGDYPYQDLIGVFGTVPPQAHYISNLAGWSTNTGLKHIQHQMQAIKGYPSFGGDSSAGVSSSSHITGTGGGNGTYKSNDISMGGMRGFKYHTTSATAVWPSTGTTVEALENTGEVSIGTTS